MLRNWANLNFRFPSNQGRSKQFLCFGPELKLAPPNFFFFFFFCKNAPSFYKKAPPQSYIAPFLLLFPGGGGCKRGLFGPIGAPFHTTLRAAAPVAPPLATALHLICRNITFESKKMAQGPKQFLVSKKKLLRLTSPPDNFLSHFWPFMGRL